MTRTELLALAMAAKTAEERKKNQPENNLEKQRTEVSLEFSQALGTDVGAAVGLG